MTLLEGVLAADTRSIARAISLLESEDSPDGEQRETEREAFLDNLLAHTGGARLIGITGPPGSGKSTLVDRLIERERRKGRRVGVIAVDPSSPFSGGALLGDRLRMQDHATDPGVFIRSMASRGQLGGVSRATLNAARVLDAAGYQTVIIETIGVGQTEIEIVELTDVVLLVFIPGAGDEIQVMKAGIMEIGDVFVINKKDLEGADRLRVELEYLLELTSAGGPRNVPPIVMTSARANEGIDKLDDVIDWYFEGIRANGALERRRRSRIARELRQILAGKIHRLLDVHFSFDQKIDDWVERIYGKTARPYQLVQEAMNQFIKEKQK